jgi:hypothetical protein
MKDTVVFDVQKTFVEAGTRNIRASAPRGNDPATWRYDMIHF